MSQKLSTHTELDSWRRHMSTKYILSWGAGPPDQQPLLAVDRCTASLIRRRTTRRTGCSITRDQTCAHGLRCRIFSVKSLQNDSQVPSGQYANEAHVQIRQQW